MRVSLAHPELAGLILAALALVALVVLALLRRRRALAAFGGAGAGLVSASPARQVAKLVFLAVALVALVGALVGPQIGEAPRRGTTSTVDTVIALDVSQSMATRDVTPDRLHVAQEAIVALGQELAGGRVGLTLFAGSSVVRYPLSADTRVLGPALDFSGRGFKINPGSSLKAALQGAAALFPTDAASAARAKAIVLISDGEDLTPDLPLLDPLRQRNITVFTLGVGTPEGGPVPIYDDKGRLIQMLVNTNGTQVTSRMDEGRLGGLAEQGGGRYWRYQGDATTRELADALRGIAVAEPAASEGGVSPEDRYQLFVAIAVFALLLEWLLDERRPMPRPQAPRVRASPRRRLLALLGATVLALVACGSSDPLADGLDATNAVFQRDPVGAVTRYRDLAVQRPSSPEIAIDLANTYATLGDFDHALVEYGHALDSAKGTTRAIAFYDRGNALFRLGRVAEARASYVEALRLDATDRDAKFNIEVIDRILGARQTPQNVPGSQPPNASPSPGPEQPAGSPGASGPTGPGSPNGTPPPGASGSPSGSPPPTVQGALTDFRKDLTVDEALRLLDALKGEQRGVEGLVEGTGVRRGGNVDVAY